METGGELIGLEHAKRELPLDGLIIIPSKKSSEECMVLQFEIAGGQFVQNVFVN